MFDIKSDFPIYKVNKSIFQLGEIICNQENLLNDIISIILLGNKFVPSYYTNKKSFFNYLLNNIDKNIIKFDNFLNISKSSYFSDKLLNEVDDNLAISINKNLSFEEVFRQIKTKNRKNLKTNENLNKKFINIETQNLRKNIHKKLFENYKKIKIMNNINYHQFQALIQFKKNKPFVILDCDKNIGNAIISNELYQTSVFNYINSDPAYIELQYNPLTETIKTIDTIIYNLWNNGHISKKFKNLLKINIKSTKLGSFRLLAKLHKEKFDWRAIINCTDHPTSKIAMFFDFLIKPIIITTETYIKDSQNLIQYVESLKLEKKPLIYSLDVSSLYQNINPVHAIPLITDFISKYLDINHINSYGFKTLLDLFFKNNIFKFKNKFFVQVIGVPMGCICGPSIANLFLYILEIKWIFIHKPLGYKRFIDDFFLILKDELDLIEFQSYFLNLKFTVHTGDIVNFLDLNISYDNINKKIKFSLYTKPTHVNKYLLPFSNHPNHIFKNIPESLFIRLRRICSDYYDYVNASISLSQQLVERGYNSKELLKTFHYIGNTERSMLLPYKIKENKLNFARNIIFFFNYSLNISKFNELLFSCFNNLTIKYPLLNNFALKFVNNIENNLNKLLVHNFPLSREKLFKTIKCFNCLICRYIYTQSYVKLKNSEISINILCNANCQTSHIVYIILCLKCNVFYMGETSKTLTVRISQHLNHIKKFRAFKKYQNKEIAKHFNLKGHNLNDHFKCCIFKDNLTEVEIRKSTEMDLVNFLNTRFFNWLNLFIQKKNIKHFAFIT